MADVPCKNTSRVIKSIPLTCNKYYFSVFLLNPNTINADLGGIEI